MGGGGKTPSVSSSAPAPTAEAPKPYQQEQDTSTATQNAREAQLRKARAALGQEGSILTSPFGSQQNTAEQRKTLLGG
jgi:hypothetical protein